MRPTTPATPPSSVDPTGSRPALAARRRLGRLGRWTSNLFVGTSLLLFAAAAGGWVASLSRTDVFSVSIGLDHDLLLAESGGELLAGTCYQSSERLMHGPDPSVHFSHMAASANVWGLGQVVWLFMIGDRQSSGWGSAGFGYMAQTDADWAERPGRAFFWPHWSVLLVTSVLPGGWLIRRWLGRKRRRNGLCGRCGYDLRASPSACPECGAAAAVSGRAPPADQPAA